MNKGDSMESMESFLKDEVRQLFTEKQFKTLQDMLYSYKEFQEELYNYPAPETLFTQTQRELFEILDIV